MTSVKTEKLKIKLKSISPKKKKKHQKQNNIYTVVRDVKTVN